MSGHIIYVWMRLLTDSHKVLRKLLLPSKSSLLDIPEQPTSAMLPNWLIK